MGRLLTYVDVERMMRRMESPAVDEAKLSDRIREVVALARIVVRAVGELAIALGQDVFAAQMSRLLLDLILGAIQRLLRALRPIDPTGVGRITNGE